MARTNCSTLPSSEMDGFLLSDVGIQPNGMPLTVLSMLARMGVDPWDEAECLSGLPNDLAVSWMAAAISRAPPYSWEQSDVAVLASRLIDRLPTHSHNPQPTAVLTDGLEAVPVWKLMMVFYVTIGIYLFVYLAIA